MTITATATPNAGTISKVLFYSGTTSNYTLLATNTSSPYSYIWSNLSTGSYSVFAQAYDSAGAETISVPVSSP